jgi:hypothetical protein
VTIQDFRVQSSAALPRCTSAHSDCYLDNYGVVNFPLFPDGCRLAIPITQLTDHSRTWKQIKVADRFVQENTFTLYKTVLS